MPKILHIQASPRGNDSFSTRAAEALLASFLTAHKDYQSETLDLFGGKLPEFRAPEAKAKYAVLSGKPPTGDAELAWKPVIDTIFGFIGFTDIRSVLVEPTLMGGPQVAEQALAKAIGELRALANDPSLVKA